jgi:hypothetical protein
MRRAPAPNPKNDADAGGVGDCRFARVGVGGWLGRGSCQVILFRSEESVSLKSPLMRFLPVAVLVMVLFPATASARKGPHLVVTSVKAAPGEQAPLHRFWGTNDRFQLIATVKNTGKAASRGGSGALQTASADRPGAFGTESYFDLPRLKPGERQNFQLGALGFEDDINAYTLRLCVPTKGGSISNQSGPENCRKGPRFGVIPQKWTASITSTDDFDVFTETAGYNFTFKYDAGRSKQTAVFDYKVTGGEAHLSVSGTDARGCSHSGTFDTGLDPLSTLDIGRRVDKYAVSVHPKVATFQTTVFCPGDPPESHPEENKFNGPWSSVGAKVDDHRATAWSGSQEEPFGKFSWLLEAK